MLGMCLVDMYTTGYVWLYIRVEAFYPKFVGKHDTTPKDCESFTNVSCVGHTRNAPKDSGLCRHLKDVESEGGQWGGDEPT